MLCVNALAGFGAGAHPSSMIDALTNLGLTANLKLCLDAGDIDSAPASATSWLDVSGAGYDFWRGTGSGADAADPTFNGNAGGLSELEYWTSDGGDFFRYDSANEAWMSTLHKNSALWSCGAWVYMAASPMAASSGLMGTGGSNSLTNKTGFHWTLNSTGANQYRCFNNTNQIAHQGGSTPAAGWHYFGASIDEAGGAVSFFRIDEAYDQVSGADTFNAAIGWGDAAESYTMEIGARGNGELPLTTEVRVAALFVAQGATLTPANHNSIFNATRSRFGV